MSSDLITVDNVSQLLPPPSAEHVLAVLRNGKNLEEYDYFPGQIAAVTGVVWGLDYHDLRSTSQVPLTSEDARILHRLATQLLDPCEPKKRHLPGRFRDRLVYIEGEPLVPPIPREVGGLVSSLFEQLEKWNEADSTLRGRFKAAAALHQFFVKIHPFIDCNGRVARLLADTFLIQSGRQGVCNWLGEIYYRLEADTGTSKACGRLPSSEYSRAIVATQRLRLNRWIHRFAYQPIPGYDPAEPGEEVKFGEIGDDYLLPLVIYMLGSAQVLEEEHLRRLFTEDADSQERTHRVKEQEEAIAAIGDYRKECTHKLRRIQEYLPEALEEFDIAPYVWSQVRMTPELAEAQHAHQLWMNFISPEVP